jgi:hypothetical protein
MGGYANVDDDVFDVPDGTYHGVAPRSFDAESRQWSIWLDGQSNANLAHRSAEAAVLDEALRGRTWLIGERLTIGDFSIGALVPTAERMGLPVREFSEIKRSSVALRYAGWPEDLIGEVPQPALPANSVVEVASLRKSICRRHDLVETLKVVNDSSISDSPLAVPSFKAVDVASRVHPINGAAILRNSDNHDHVRFASRDIAVDFNEHVADIVHRRRFRWATAASRLQRPNRLTKWQDDAKVVVDCVVMEGRQNQVRIASIHSTTIADDDVVNRLPVFEESQPGFSRVDLILRVCGFIDHSYSPARQFP